MGSGVPRRLLIELQNMNIATIFLTAAAAAAVLRAGASGTQPWFAAGADCGCDIGNICRGKVTHVFLRPGGGAALCGEAVRCCRENGVGVWVALGMDGAADDWSEPDVRAEHLSRVEDAASSSADGVALDWMRTGRVFRPGGEMAGAPLLDDFMRSAAETIRRNGLKVAVRVPPDPETGAEFGFNAVRWAKEGLVDVVIPAPLARAASDLPVEDWREALEGTDVRLVPDLGRNLPPAGESYAPVFFRGIAQSFVVRGADGVCLWSVPRGPAGEELCARGVFPGADLAYDCPVSMHDWPTKEMLDGGRRDAFFEERRGGYLALQARIDAASAAGGGRVVAEGTVWCDGPVVLKSGVELHFADGARLVFNDNPARYPAVMSSWEGVECLNHSPLIYAFGATNVSITGRGTIAPRMDRWIEWIPRTPEHMAATRRLYDWCSFAEPVGKRDLTKVPGANARPQLIMFNRCADVRLEGFRVRQSPFWVMHLFLCRNVHVKDIDVVALGNNTDGIDIEMSRDVLVEGCTFREGDDAIVIKAGRNRDGWRLATPSENIEIRNCTVRRGNSVFGIGSEMSGGVRNVWIHDCKFDGFGGTLLRLKTNERRGGFIENVRMERIEARGRLLGPVLGIDTDAMFQWREFPTHEVRITRISGIHLKDVRAERVGRRLCVRGDARRPIAGICLENVRAAEAKCADVVENAEVATR